LLRPGTLLTRWTFAGTDDEVFYADRYAGLFEAAGKQIPVTLVPGIRHVPLTLEPEALAAAVAAVDRMDESKD